MSLKKEKIETSSIYSSQQLSAQPIKGFDNVESTYFAYLIY